MPASARQERRCLAGGIAHWRVLGRPSHHAVSPAGGPQRQVQRPHQVGPRPQRHFHGPLHLGHLHRQVLPVPDGSLRRQQQPGPNAQQQGAAAATHTPTGPRQCACLWQGFQALKALRGTARFKRMPPAPLACLPARLPGQPAPLTHPVGPPRCAAQLRIYKHYAFDLRQLRPAASRLSFSSYPGGTSTQRSHRVVTQSG